MIQPNFSTLGPIIEISPQGPKISFVFNNSIRNLLRLNETILYKEYNMSPAPVEILSLDKFFIHKHIAEGTFFKGKRSGIIHNFTMNVDPGYKYIEKIRGGIQWYMMETKDFVSSISFELKNEKNELVSSNGQSVPFRFSIKEV